MGPSHLRALWQEPCVGTLYKVLTGVQRLKTVTKGSTALRVRLG